MSMRFFATSPKGMEDLLVEELRQLGASAAKASLAGAYFQGDLALAYRVCLWSRLANRILLPLAKFPASDAEALYAGVYALHWDQHLGLDNTFLVDFNGSNAQINNTHFGALKVKDAVVDWFRTHQGGRPSIVSIRPDLRLNLHLYGDDATLSLDLSGESLHRRSYRQDGGLAPLKENLAAAILVRAGWPAIAAAGGALVDPLCGSGTLPIEAALIASDTAPGLLRDYFGFLGWKQHDAALWKSLREEAQTRRTLGLSRLPPIFGYDADPRAVRNALVHLKQAGLDGYIQITQRALAELSAPPVTPGLVIANPPYGERLGEVALLEPLYTQLGERLRTGFGGWRASLFTGNPDLGKRMGLRAKKHHALYNGALPCRLLHFDISPDWFVREPLPLALPSPPADHPFANRLRKNLHSLGRWAKREKISCYRVYDADMPEYAVAVDYYEHWAQVQEYAPPKTIDPDRAAARLQEVMHLVPQVLGLAPEQVFLKVRQRQKGSAQYEKLDDSGQFHEVHEGQAVFLVNFTDYLDTGLFLDHRLTRQLIQDSAAGTRFLNLFCYTATATVYAALGGARQTTSVDMSHSYLQWGQRNLARNGFSEHAHRFIQADCLTWLAQEPGQYDLIFLDPPTFSNSKRMDASFDVLRDQVPLLRAAMARLAPGGSLIFSTNHQRFKLDSAALSDFTIEALSAATLPEDFRRNPKIHQCWRIRQVSTVSPSPWQRVKI